MKKFSRVAERYEENKAIIDYSRTIATLLALAALFVTAVVGFHNSPPDNQILYTATSIAIGMFGLLTGCIMVVCIRLTQAAILDVVMPSEFREPWIRVAITVSFILSLLVISGSGTLISYVIFSAIG